MRNLETPGHNIPWLTSSFLGAIVSAINRTLDGQMSPVIEGPFGFLPELPSRLISAGKFHSVDFVGGHCTGDGKSFAGGKPEQFVTDDDIRTRVFLRWPGVVSQVQCPSCLCLLTSLVKFHDKQSIGLVPCSRYSRQSFPHPVGSWINDG